MSRTDRRLLEGRATTIVRNTYQVLRATIQGKAIVISGCDPIYTRDYPHEGGTIHYGPWHKRKEVLCTIERIGNTDTYRFHASFPKHENRTDYLTMINYLSRQETMTFNVRTKEGTEL